MTVTNRGWERWKWKKRHPSKIIKEYQTTLTELLSAAEGIVFGRRGMYPVVQKWTSGITRDCG